MLADMHLHTDCSPDGVTPPAALVARALARGIGMVAVTDHDTIRGARLALAAARGTGLEVVLGSELTTDAGHIQALGIVRDVLPGRPRPLPWRAAVADIRAQGGIAILAHPFRTDRPLDPAVLEAVDGVEVWNGRVRWSRYAAANRRADLAWRAARPGLLATAGSDGHCPAEVGAACLEGPDLPGRLSTPALRAWLEAGARAWASRPSALCQTRSQLRKAMRTRDVALGARAVARALWRTGETLTPPASGRREVWRRVPAGEALPAACEVREQGAGTWR